MGTTTPSEVVANIKDVRSGFFVKPNCHKMCPAAKANAAVARKLTTATAKVLLPLFSGNKVESIVFVFFF